MAKVTITISDEENGVGVQVDFDPPVTDENQVPTVAQSCAVEMLRYFENLTKQQGAANE